MVLKVDAAFRREEVSAEVADTLYICEQPLRLCNLNELPRTF